MKKQTGQSKLYLIPSGSCVCLHVHVCLCNINTACVNLLYSGWSLLFSVCIWCSLIMAAVVLHSRERRPSSCMFLRRIWSLAMREQRAHRKFLILLVLVQTKFTFSYSLTQRWFWYQTFASPYKTLIVWHSVLIFPVCVSSQPLASQPSQHVFSLWWLN